MPHYFSKRPSPSEQSISLVVEGVHTGGLSQGGHPSGPSHVATLASEARSAQLMTRYFCIWSSLYTVTDWQRIQCTSLWGTIQWTDTQLFKLRRCAVSSACAAPSTFGEEMGRVTWAESFSVPMLASTACTRSLHGNAQHFLEFSEHTRLRVADTLVPARRRATWLHPASQTWHE